MLPPTRQLPPRSRRGILRLFEDPRERRSRLTRQRILLKYMSRRTAIALCLFITFGGYLLQTWWEQRNLEQLRRANQASQPPHTAPPRERPTSRQLAAALPGAPLSPEARARVRVRRVDLDADPPVTSLEPLWPPTSPPPAATTPRFAGTVVAAFACAGAPAPGACLATRGYNLYRLQARDGRPPAFRRAERPVYCQGRVEGLAASPEEGKLSLILDAEPRRLFTMTPARQDCAPLGPPLENRVVALAWLPELGKLLALEHAPRQGPDRLSTLRAFTLLAPDGGPPTRGALAPPLPLALPKGTSLMEALTLTWLPGPARLALVVGVPGDEVAYLLDPATGEVRHIRGDAPGT